MALFAGHLERDLPKPRVLQLLPGIAVGVLLLAVVALLWLVDHNARQAARNDLIQDALWVEQSLRFQLRSAEERVREFGGERRRPEAVAGARPQPALGASGNPASGADESRRHDHRRGTAGIEP